MYANGFLEEKRRSPASLVAVIGLHGAALAAVMIFGTYTFVKQDPHRTTLIDIADPQPPEPVPPPPPRHPDQQTPQQLERVTATDTSPINPNTLAAPPTPPAPAQPIAPTGPVQIARADVPALPVPVRHAAFVDPNYRDALQPPYPRPMLDAQRNGSVRVRITIGTDGRVSAIEQLSATDDAFWRVTERQARSRWRFRPATLDGRPIVSTMLMTVTFRIPDEG